MAVCKCQTIISRYAEPSRPKEVNSIMLGFTWCLVTVHETTPVLRVRVYKNITLESFVRFE